MVSNIQRVEEENKWGVLLEVVQQLQIAYNNLNPIWAYGIAQDVMYAKQRAFEYRAKAGNQRAWVLSERAVSQGVLPWRKSDGEFTKDTIEKLEIFANYYQELYTLLEREKEGMKTFLDKLVT